MVIAHVLGWVAAGASILIGLPQLIRLLRTRNTDGLSLLNWQLILANNVSWLMHGILIQAANMIAMNSISLIQTAAILVLLIRQRSLRPLLTLLPSVLIITVMVGTDLGFGSLYFGIVAVGVVVLANGGQSLRLVRAESISGVAPGYLVATALAAVLWFSWAFSVNEHGTMVQTVAGGTIALFNVVWWGLRRLGIAR